jgi:acyl-CoA synthetase (AMP-forming)/AMP-acid ligase II
MFGAMQDWPLRLPRLFDHAAREHGTREIVSLQADGSLIRSNWAEAVADGRRLMAGLARLGIAPGDRVATLASNHLRHLVSWIGTIGMGGVLHTINPRLFDDQLSYIANHAGDRILFYDPAFAPLVERLKPSLTTIEHYIPFDAAFDALLDGGDPEAPWLDGDERAPAMLCYTSGTTGNPKGVIYEHRSQVLHSFVQPSPDVFNLSARSVVLPFVPMFHAAAWGLPFAAMMIGVKLVLSMTNEPARLHELMQAEGVTHSCGVPTIWLSLLQHVEQTGGDFGKLAQANCGGSAAPRALIAAFEDRGVAFRHLWGMTETSPVGTVCALPAHWDEMDREARLDLLQKQGRSSFGVELRVVDEEGVALPRDGRTSGRLQVRGDWIVKRYFRAEADAIDGSTPATSASSTRTASSSSPIARRT